MAKSNAFTHRFVNEGSNVRLELTNATRETLKTVEVLTVFLKNEEAEIRGPSQVHIRFEAIERIHPAEKSIMHHTIYINGKAADADCDRLQQLQIEEGKDKPYVLDISWQNPEGRTRFQRIPVGH
jgi:hypothetical protein